MFFFENFLCVELITQEVAKRYSNQDENQDNSEKDDVVKATCGKGIKIRAAPTYSIQSYCGKCRKNCNVPHLFVTCSGCTVNYHESCITSDSDIDDPWLCKLCC